MKKIVVVFIFLLVFINVPFVFAQEGITLSITPPLIKNNMNPGDIWKSTIKVANNNPEEHTIYVEAVDFRAKQEDGVVEFLSSEKTGTSSEGVSPFLSQWIVLEENEVVIPAFGSREIPYIIDVPENASPGGHYAAILAGTRPPADSVSGSVIKVSSLLASLVLLNVKGDVEERGVIREFVSDKVFYDKTDVGFKVRFENLGNVHLQPLGEIKIYAPFNKLKNTITINHNSEFGNVLPESIRKWEFNWKGDKNLLEMGRYRAELILGYGEEGRQADNRVIYFWVIYPKPVIFAVSAVIIFILLITVLIRLYIRRAIRNTTGLNTQIVGKKSEPAKKIFFKRSQSKPEKKDDVINLKK